MAAPTLTARQDPAGIKLKDGYKSVYAFNRDPDISLWEMEVGPPGMDGGDAIETSTMHNDIWRTMAARALKTLTESTFTFAYDPAVYTQLNNLINEEGSITQHFPDGSTLTFYGYLRVVEFDPLVEGEMPTGTATVTPTNQDPVTGAEEGPVVASVAGT